ncbi:MAG: hypothetical protein ACAH83_10570 [Alphaproteobacteria bacterium]
MTKDFFIYSFISLCLFISAPSFAQDKPAFTDAEYLALVDAALKDPAKADWTGIRTLYIQSSFYDEARRHGMGGSHFSTAGAKAAKEKSPEAIAQYKDEARKYAGAIDTHLEAYKLHTKEKADFIDIQFTNGAFKGLAEAMLKTGDGHSMKTAIHAASTSEQYFLMRSWYRLTPRGKTLEPGGGHIFDIHKVVDAQGKDVGDIFFNIDLYFGRMEFPPELQKKFDDAAKERAPVAVKRPESPRLPAEDKRYLDLVDAAAKDPAHAQWDELRALYPGTTYYQRIGGFNLAHHARDMTDFAAKRMSPEAIDAYRKFQREHYASVGAHSAAMTFYKMKKPDFVGYSAEEAAYNALLQSVRKTGDGKTHASAFRVLSLEEASHLAMTYFKPSPDLKIENEGEQRYLVFRGDGREGAGPATLYFAIDPRAKPSESRPENLPVIATMTISLPAGGKAEADAPLTTSKEREARKISFIVLDMDGDGIGLGNIKEKQAVYWDIDSDGFAEATAWPRPGEAFLAVDLNGDGVINGNAELFGVPGTGSFQMLAEKDDNRDKRIDKADAVWPHLLLWQDLNHNGYSERGEISGLGGRGIEGIEFGGSAAAETVSGNIVLSRGTYRFRGADGQVSSREAASVIFAYDDVNTIDIRNNRLDIRVLSLPALRGYGVLPDLHKAMSKDNHGAGNLLEQVQSLSTLTLNDILDDPKSYEGRINGIIYRWAQADKIKPDSRGPNFDARQLAALEKLMGEKFRQEGAGGLENPLFFGALKLHQGYNSFFGHVFGALAAQTAGKRLFTGKPYYHAGRDVFGGIQGLDIPAIAGISAALESKEFGARKSAWKAVVRIVEFSAGTKALPKDDLDALDGLISKSDPSLSLAGVLEWVKTVDIRAIPGNDYASKALGLSAKDGDITQVARAARSKDSSKQIVYSDVATEILKDCCKSETEVIAYLQERQYVVAELPLAEMKKESGTEMPYTRVIKGVWMPGSWDKFKALFSQPYEFNMVTVYMNGDKVEWAYAHIQK